MSKHNSVKLNELQISNVKQKAEETRQSFGALQNVPIGNDIRLLLEKQGVFLCEYPFPDSAGTHTYGNITWFKIDKETITFIGLNTSSYYDEQIFALAHEIYHFITRTGKAYSPELEYEDEKIEKMADRFAAELLLPAGALMQSVKETFETLNLFEVTEKKILWFAAKTQCEWWLPYRAVINRFLEEDLITEEQYGRLFDIDCRSEDSGYRRILKTVDSEISELLNKKTKSIRISNKIIETIISNYEDGFIDDDEFVDTLALFDKKPEDVGYNLAIELDEDFNELFESGDNG